MFSWNNMPTQPEKGSMADAQSAFRVDKPGLRFSIL